MMGGGALRWMAVLDGIEKLSVGPELNDFGRVQEGSVTAAVIAWSQRPTSAKPTTDEPCGVPRSRVQGHVLHP